VALFRVTIPKIFTGASFVGHTWRNVYVVEAPDYDTALAVGDTISIHEIDFHTVDVTIPEIVAHAYTEPARRVGKQLAVNRQGLLAFDDEYLPLWNCVRVDFIDSATGRPERKYYRVPLQKKDITGLILESTLYSTVNVACASIMALTNYVGPSGEGHSSQVVSSLVQMRQTGWHRRKRPGFVRGYVPV
jgi:hypothetical protein